MFEHFYLMVTGQDYRKLVEEEQERAKKEAEVAAAAAQAQAQAQAQAEVGKRRRKRSKSPKDDALDLAEDLNLERVGRDHSSDSCESDEVEHSDNDERDLTASQLARKRKRQKAKDANKAFQQVKHTFDINIKELKNIPILTRFIREAKDFETATVTRKKTPVSDEESKKSEDLT